jgi:hypothetical protein
LIKGSRQAGAKLRRARIERLGRRRLAVEVAALVEPSGRMRNEFFLLAVDAPDRCHQF